MISGYRKNVLGTACFEGKFPGMRKAQEFIVYPMAAKAEDAQIQSDTRIGRIHLATGEVLMSAPAAGGAYGRHLATAKVIAKLDAEALLLFKAQIAATAGKSVGASVMTCDNSGAASVLG